MNLSNQIQNAFLTSAKQMFLLKKNLKIFLVILTLIVWSGEAFGGPGIMGGFIYLIPKPGKEIPFNQRNTILETIKIKTSSFGNDFNPSHGRPDTITYLKGTRYSLKGQTLNEKVPKILIRVESRDREKVDAFYQIVKELLGEYFDLEYRFAVTGPLNYTDADTLAKLREQAPRRYSGNDDPNAVVFPLSKNSAWWAMDVEKKAQYFNPNPSVFGEGHLGHNGVGFQYIQMIFRKLYHSKDLDPQQDFMTYFEFPDEYAEAFDKLLNGLRDERTNPEWKFVEESPIFWGIRMRSLDQLL